MAKRVARVPAPPTAAQVAANVQNNVRKFSRVIHRQVYANAHKYTPEQVLAALGDKAAHVTDLLASATAVVVTPVTTATPIVTARLPQLPRLRLLPRPL